MRTGRGCIQIGECVLLARSMLHSESLQHTVPHNTTAYLQMPCVLASRTLGHCNALQQTATDCSTVYLLMRCVLASSMSHPWPLQRTAVHCNTLQHTATHCSAVYLLRPCVLASSTSRSERKVCKCGVNVMSECMKRFCSGSYIIYVAVCCGVLQCVVVTKSATEFAKTQGVYSYVALRCVAVCCSVLQ